MSVQHRYETQSCCTSFKENSMWSFNKWPGYWSTYFVSRTWFYMFQKQRTYLWVLFEQYSCTSSLSRHRKNCPARLTEHNKVQRKVVSENTQLHVVAHGQENIDYISTDFLSNCVMNVTGLMEINDGYKWIKTSSSSTLDIIDRNLRNIADKKIRDVL